MNNEFDKSLLKECCTDVYIIANVEIKRPHLVSIGNHVAIDSGFYITTQAEIGYGISSQNVEEGWNIVTISGADWDFASLDLDLESSLNSFDLVISSENSPILVLVLEKAPIGF